MESSVLGQISTSLIIKIANNFLNTFFILFLKWTAFVYFLMSQPLNLEI